MVTGRVGGGVGVLVAFPFTYRQSTTTWQGNCRGCWGNYFVKVGVIEYFYGTMDLWRGFALRSDRQVRVYE